MSDHDWHERFNLTCCKVCGIVRRADGKNKPCRGPMRLRPMERFRPLEPDNSVQRLAKEIGAEFQPEHETKAFCIAWTKALAKVVQTHTWQVLHKYPDDVRAWAQLIIDCPATPEAMNQVTSSISEEIHAIDYDDGWATDKAGSALEYVCLAMLPDTRWLANAAKDTWKFATGCGAYNDVVKLSQDAWLCHLYRQVAATPRVMAKEQL